MKRKNCWEFMKCGREPGGENADELGICPAALPGDYNGINKGKFGGRFCWAVSGTFCDGELQGTFARNLINCMDCDFLKQVNEDEHSDFTLTPQDAKKKGNSTDE